MTGSDSSLRRSGRLLSFESNLRNSKTRNQDLVNPVKVWILSTILLKFFTVKFTFAVLQRGDQMGRLDNGSNMYFFILQVWLRCPATLSPDA